MDLLWGVVRLSPSPYVVGEQDHAADAEGDDGGTEEKGRAGNAAEQGSPNRTGLLDLRQGGGADEPQDSG